jgi:hypothetical protein
LAATTNPFFDAISRGLFHDAEQQQQQYEDETANDGELKCQRDGAESACYRLPADVTVRGTAHYLFTGASKVPSGCSGFRPRMHFGRTKPIGTWSLRMTHNFNVCPVKPGAAPAPSPRARLRTQ